MPLIRYVPAPPLDAYVECFWWSERDAPQPFHEHMLPSGKAQLIFALHETPILCLPKLSQDPVSWSRGVVHGPQWNHFVSGPKPRGTVAGVAFRPGAAGAVLGIPITEVTDRHISIDDLWGHRAGELHERLSATRDPATAFHLLERDLIARLEPSLLMHPAVTRALSIRAAPCTSLRVVDVQREAGYSPRHFIALFRAAVGLTPKHYYRVQRFADVLQGLAGAGSTNLAGLAAATGYSDQSHLTREFRAFTGIAPTQYRPRSADGIFHHRAHEVKNVQDRRAPRVTESLRIST